MLRRRKADVETELPEPHRPHLFRPAEPTSRRRATRSTSSRWPGWSHMAKRRPLTQQELDKLMRELAMMRMICDTTYILDSE